MRNQFFIMAVLVVSWIGLASLMPSGEVEIPLKKINKAISKIWKVDKFDVLEDELNNDLICKKNGCWLRVKRGKTDIGKIYVGRVNSCHAGGCSIEGDDNASLAFEFFDYFFLTDTTGKVLWVKVFNYQATQGHEVMSRGWLNQFKGVCKNQKLIFGQDIEAISGATVSAEAITNDIQLVLSCTTTF